MPAQKYPLISEFIIRALMSELYPKTIFFDPDDPNITCIHLINQNKQEGGEETKKMLADYAALKPRKCTEKGSNRQRFLQGMKRSPYITILAKSTKDKKFILLKEGELEHGISGNTSVLNSTEVLQNNDTLVPELYEYVEPIPPSTPTLHEDALPLQLFENPPSEELRDLDLGLDHFLLGNLNVIYENQSLSESSLVSRCGDAIIHDLNGGSIFWSNKSFWGNLPNDSSQ